jgi:hypothetical protein
MCSPWLELRAKIPEKTTQHEKYQAIS